MTTQKYGCKSLEDDSMRRVNENQSDKSKEKGKKKKKSGFKIYKQRHFHKFSPFLSGGYQAQLINTWLINGLLRQTH